MRLHLKHLQKEDAKKCLEIDEQIKHLSKRMLMCENELVVSLTSYGQRITNTLPYTLYSLLKQEVMPGRIAVYLSKDEICHDALPGSLLQLERVGVEFYFVRDTKSYKKLIPALEMFPNQPILTVDDDMYYPSNFIKLFLETYHESDKRTVLGTAGCIVARDEAGKLKPYSQWNKPTEQNIYTQPVSFYGCGGCLYPPHIFDGEIYKEEIFSSLAPFADDLWFWVMEVRCGVQTQLINCFKNIVCTPVDRTMWFELERVDCLTSVNVTQGKNDEQLRNLLEYYNLH